MTPTALFFIPASPLSFSENLPKRFPIPQRGFSPPLKGKFLARPLKQKGKKPLNEGPRPPYVKAPVKDPLLPLGKLLKRGPKEKILGN